jgi:DNA polymerase
VTLFGSEGDGGAGSGARSGNGSDKGDGRAQPPPSDDLGVVREAALGCRACHLWERATQTVFGAGPEHAEVVLVGEQPGDQEDLAGEPFVGPAGKLLDGALVDAGIDRSHVYVTNVVKHFKWEPRGKRRIHQTPNQTEVVACRPWLDRELEILSPRAVMLLGATAAKAILGPSFRVSRDRGKPIPSDLAPLVMATVHPSSILRARDAEREVARQGLVDDLSALAARL